MILQQVLIMASLHERSLALWSSSNWLDFLRAYGFVKTPSSIVDFRTLNTSWSAGIVITCFLPVTPVPDSTWPNCYPENVTLNLSVFCYSP